MGWWVGEEGGGETREFTAHVGTAAAAAAHWLWALAMAARVARLRMATSFILLARGIVSSDKQR